MTDRKVFVVDRDTRHDISDARRFGEITYIYDERDRKPSVWSNALIKDVMARLERCDYDADLDYILVVGNVVTIVMIVANLAMAYDTLNLLLFDASQEEYVHKTVTPVLSA